MKAWQRHIRERIANESGGLFADFPDDTSLDRATVRPVSSKEAAQVILKYEWLGTMPSVIRGCYGMFNGQHMAGALVFAEKPGANLAGSAKSAIPLDAHYLARGACVHWAHPHAASWFISKICRELLCRNGGSIVAYADPSAGEIGTIYQALGWYYIGAGTGGPTGYVVDGVRIPTKMMQRRYGSRSFETIKREHPEANIVPILRKARYIGVYGPARYKREAIKKIAPYVLPYPKRESSGVNADSKSEARWSSNRESGEAEFNYIQCLNPGVK